MLQCSPPSVATICSSFNRENGHGCSWMLITISTAYIPPKRRCLAPEKIDGWNMKVPFKWSIFKGHVNVRGGGGVVFEEETLLFIHMFILHVWMLVCPGCEKLPLLSSKCSCCSWFVQDVNYVHFKKPQAPWLLFFEINSLDVPLVHQALGFLFHLIVLCVCFTIARPFWMGKEWDCEKPWIYTPTYTESWKLCNSYQLTCDLEMGPF